MFPSRGSGCSSVLAVSISPGVDAPSCADTVVNVASADVVVDGASASGTYIAAVLVPTVSRKGGRRASHGVWDPGVKKGYFLGSPNMPGRSDLRCGRVLEYSMLSTAVSYHTWSQAIGAHELFLG